MGNSVEVAPLSATREDRLSSILPGIQGWTLLLLGAWLYHSILYRLAVQWGTDPNFSHGFFVPLFAFYVLWQDRERLKKARTEPSCLGLLVVFLALVMLVVGVLGVELFTSRFSLLVLIFGLIVLFRGWPFLRAVLFPLIFLVLAIPLPNLILQKFTFPLQILASQFATFMLRAAGIVVNREGNVINLAHMSLEVVEACSGIRSLLTLVTLAIIYGYLLERRMWVRVVLTCAAVPIAVVANAFRIFGTGVLGQYWDPQKAQGFFHEFQGWLIFVVSLLLLFAVHRLIDLIWKPPARTELPAASAPVTTQAVSASPGSLWNRLPRFLAVAFLMIAAALVLQAHSQNEVFPPRQDLTSLPMQIDGWTTNTNEVLDDQTLDILGHPEYVLRDYFDSSGKQPWIDLFIAYYPTQKAGETPHTPAHCLPGAGWVPTERQVVQISGSDGMFPVNRYVVSKGRDRQLVLYWFQAHGREVASEYRLKYYLVADSIRMHRSDGALIRLMTPMYQGESADAAQARIMQLGSPLIPLLDNYIPR